MINNFLYTPSSTEGTFSRKREKERIGRSRRLQIHINKFILYGITNITLFIFLLWSLSAQAIINIVAAENMYGSVAKEIGGDKVNVVSILNNPNQDPHLFSASPSTARAVAKADIIVYNGIAYDGWMDKLLSVQKNPSQKIIIIANLVGAKMGDNPHLWYSPNTMPVYAQYLTTQLQQLDPANKSFYATQLINFQKNYQQLNNKINQIKQHYHNISVIATEPLFNDMAQALGFNILAKPFQMNIMNDVEPTPTQLRDFENDLNSHSARIFFYNKQVISPLTLQLQKMAINERISVVGVTETQPEDMNYIQWMLNQLIATEQALDAKSN